MKYSHIISLLLIIQCSAIGQVRNHGKPYLKNYSSNDYSGERYQLSPQNWEIHQDAAGLMYFGNSSGILVFDGVEWRSIFLPNNAAIRAIESDDEHRIFIGGENEFGLLRLDESGEYDYHSLKNLLPKEIRYFGDIWDIHSLGDSLIFRADYGLFVYSDDSIVDVIASRDKLFFSFTHLNQLLVFEKGRGLTKLKEGKLVMMPGGSYFKNHTARAVLPMGNGELLFASPIDGLILYDGQQFRQWDISASDYLIEHLVYCGLKMPDGSFAFGTQGGGVLVIDQQGNPVQIFNEDQSLQNAVVYDMMLDYRQNLWLALSDGISYLKINSPFTYYTHHIGIPKHTYFAAKFQGRLYFSSDEGVFSKPWRDIDQQWENNHAEFLERSKGQTWKFTAIDSFLLCGHNPGVLVIKDNKIKKVLAVSANVWQVLPDELNSDLYYACAQDGLYLLGRAKGEIDLLHKIKGFTGRARIAITDSTGALWISDGSEKVRRLSLNEQRDSVLSIRVFSENEGLPKATGNKVLRMDHSILVVNQNLCENYRFDFQQGKFYEYTGWPERLGVNDDCCILERDSSGNYWTLCDGLVHYFEKHHQGYRSIAKPFAKFLGHDMTGFSQVDTGNILFCTQEYVINFNPQHQIISDDFDVHIRKITCLKNDSILFYGNNPPEGSLPWGVESPDDPKLPYKMNDIRFDYAATYFEEPENTVYKVWLEGYEEEPDAWMRDAHKSYTNLKAGRYIFHLTAKNIYQTRSREILLPFSVTPPWYRTVLAYILFLLSVLLLLYALIRLYVRKLHHDRAHLELIVRERTREIEIQKNELKKQAVEQEKLNEELKRLNVTKDKFFSIIAHDLKNPFHSILGLAELLYVSYDHYDNTKVKEFLQEIYRTTNKGYELLTNLLEWSRAQTGSLTVQPQEVNIGNVVEDNLELLHSSAEEKQIKLVNQVEEETTGWVDENSLTTVLRNLISNAIKFTSHGGMVKVFAEHRGEELAVLVEDNGRGMTQEEVHNLFRLDVSFTKPGTNKERGTGLGLILCKELMDKNEGRIEVDSEQGQGTVFQVILKKTGG